MNTLIWILIFAPLPFIAFEIYFRILQRNSLNVIQKFKTKESKVFSDLKVWFKNYDHLKKVKNFENNPFITLYSFNDADIIFNTDSFLLIGKTKFQFRERILNPTIFRKNKSSENDRIVEILNITQNGNDTEVQFNDPTYTNLITLVIKAPHFILKTKLADLNNVNNDNGLQQ